MLYLWRLKLFIHEKNNMLENNNLKIVSFIEQNYIRYSYFRILGN